MRFNNDPRIRIFLLAMIILIVGLSYLTKILSDNFIYKYLDCIKQKLIQNILVGIHWIISLVLALIVPEYLMKFELFKDIFENSQIWICLATLCMFFISLIIVGGIFNLVFWRKVKD